ncbi:MAG: hypothetical protein EOP24_36850 [Hyphomicrobiales bacterium]|nr:MAG: hypothetical protein EOP24_36850 [Hyphomicrobiales bacterium]
MKMYRDPASIKALAVQIPATDLQHMVWSRLKSLVQEDADHTALLLAVMVMEEGDTAADLEEALGFTVLRNRWNGLTPDAKQFTPSWDALDDHPDWYELTFILSDAGEGMVVFIPKGLSGSITDLCRTHATQHKEAP